MSTIEKAINRKNQQSDLEQTTIEKAQSIEQEDIEQPLVAAEASSQTGANKGVATSSKTTINIDLDELERKNFVSLSSDRRLINEEYRVIKRKLINNAFGGLSSTLKHPNLILVSSSRPGEGKTFSAINLALSIALEQDKTVLLVDSDVLRPKVSKTLNINHEVGLTDYLQSEEIQVTDIIINTNIERLKIVTAGSPHHLSTELLASERMLMLVNEFASRYPDRIVIFDAPPLLGVNETSVMASMCGQAVIVVEENRSKLAEIEQAVSLLPKDIAIGFLINKAHRNQGKGYGYGYYYGAD
ncbi:XrtA-associated tyrosine autokinase [Rheinheimera sp. MMS21-TC3]|uniref:XrtA-associated tyrosine autokinase n=1 Tax=Rheinheimera sp. MMS21-TC3 TaxID=3072790 RepID=UPI0028C44D42|nr:XrtA-associated tyrosine autokinase [Rheinheimera sp. MMS21-TC3]WNO60701.1 XrtA-associated tyrosine autokinase [Rheinheimera sp. MMS21-TC3]